MTTLKSLTFTTFVPPVTSTMNPIEKRRVKVIARLEDQKKLLANADYTRIVKKRKDGQLVEKRQKIRPMWFEVEDGKFVFLVKAGFKPIEFANGKPAIMVPDLNRLPGIIDTVIAAIKEGELDGQLEQASSQTRTRLKKKKK